MAEIPDEVVIVILSWLPVKSLLQFKSVSKQWKTLISNPSFIQLHLAHSIQDPNNYSLIMKRDSDIYQLHGPQNLESSPNICSAIRFNSLLLEKAEIISSCNGLVCLAFEMSIFIFNPCTRELTRLPDAPTFQRPGYEDFYGSSLWSFGYSLRTQEYKVLRFGYLNVAVSINNADGSFDDIPYTTPDEVKEVVVHTVGTDSWRSVAEISDNLLNPGVYLNGALHWPRNFEPDVIISFDVETEVYEYMHIPSFRCYYDAFLGVLRGLLSVSCRHSGRTYAAEIWVMTDYGVEETWVHQFTIEMTELYYFKPLWWIENGVLIKATYGGLFIFDQKTEEFCAISNLEGAVVFVESLVSLKSNEKVRNNMVEVLQET